MSGAPVRRIVATWGALVGLCAASLGFAYVPLGAAQAPLALCIAAAMAALIATMFMAVHRAARVTQLAAATGAMALLVMIALVLADILTRSQY